MFSKYYILFVFTYIFIQIQPVNAQRFESGSYVLGIGGTAKNIQLSGKLIHLRQSVGQNGITGTVKNKHFTLIQGFIHPRYLKKNRTEEADLDIDIQTNLNANSYNISIKDDIQGNIYVGMYNLSGQRVYFNILKNVNSFIIDMDILPKGLYILNIRTANKMFSAKLLKP